jgi:pyruvate/2-oxoglutarate dehydrogenase complex dihydrolipoamide dehydrogenase (E3) component
LQKLYRENIGSRLRIRLKFKRFPVDYRVIPWATYTDLEVARVGLNMMKDAPETNTDTWVDEYGNPLLTICVPEAG